MEKKIYLLIGGDSPVGSDSDITERGVEQMRCVKASGVLPESENIIAGLGIRHLKSAQCAGLDVNMLHPICGQTNNQSNFSQHIRDHNATEIKHYLNNVKNNSILIVDKVFLEDLDKKFFHLAQTKVKSLDGLVVELKIRNIKKIMGVDFHLMMINFKILFSPEAIDPVAKKFKL